MLLLPLRVVGGLILLMLATSETGVEIIESELVQHGKIAENLRSRLVWAVRDIPRGWRGLLSTEAVRPDTVALQFPNPSI